MKTLVWVGLDVKLKSRKSYQYISQYILEKPEGAQDAALRNSKNISNTKSTSRVLED